MTVDKRDEQTRHLMKFNDVVDTLNPTVAVFKSKPELVHRQKAYRNYQVHHLKHQNIILRLETRTLQILSPSLPFTLISSIKLPDLY